MFAFTTALRLHHHLNLSPQSFRRVIATSQTLVSCNASFNDSNSRIINLMPLQNISTSCLKPIKHQTCSSTMTSRIPSSRSVFQYCTSPPSPPPPANAATPSPPTPQPPKPSTPISSKPISSISTTSPPTPIGPRRTTPSRPPRRVVRGVRMPR